MVSESSLKLTFLPWLADGRNNDSQKRLLSARRHQHTALAGHRKHRDRKNQLRDNADSEATTICADSPGQLSESETDSSWSVTRSATPTSSRHGVSDLERPPDPRLAIRTSPFGPFKTFGDMEPSVDFQRVLHAGMNKTFQ